MRRFLSFLILLICLASVAIGEGFADYTFDELHFIQQLINEEIHSRPEWKEVTVPAGVWIVGEDIPAGNYSITATEDLSVIRLTDKNDHYVFYKTMSKGEFAGKVPFYEGCTLQIYNPIILAPAITLDF